MTDSKHHSADRFKETKLINQVRRAGPLARREPRRWVQSLANLKECIRARTLAALELEAHTHVPFRASKLTLVLKVRALTFGRSLSSSTALSDACVACVLRRTSLSRRHRTRR